MKMLPAIIIVHDLGIILLLVNILDEKKPITIKIVDRNLRNIFIL